MDPLAIQLAHGVAKAASTKARLRPGWPGIHDPG